MQPHAGHAAQPPRPRMSVILPTRGRVGLVHRLLDSIVRTAERPEALEILLYLDADDSDSHAIRRDDLHLVHIVGHASRMGEITREAYARATADAVLLLNDDTVCRSEHWDRRLLDALSAWPDGVGMVWCNDLFRGSAIPNFPCLWRATGDLLGGPCPPDYSRDYIDAHLYDVFLKLNRRGHRRLAYLDDVVIEHLHHEAGKSDFDATSVKPGWRADELSFIAWELERQLAAEALARRIASHAAGRGEGDRCAS